MKKIFFVIILFTIFFACSSDESSEKNALEEISNDGIHCIQLMTSLIQDLSQAKIMM